MRWLYHVLRIEELSWQVDARYAPASLAREGFLHTSYANLVAESAALYFPADAELRVLAIDPRRLDVGVDVVDTPRGPMPHVKGSIPMDAIRILELSAMTNAPDVVSGTRVGFAAYEGMTLLDLVGPFDALSRIASMGFDPTTTCEVFSLLDGPVFEGSGLTLTARRHRPPLETFDVLVIPGGIEARLLAMDGALSHYLGSFPSNRLLASVCTGALLLGPRLQGKRATTHASALERLPAFGAHPVCERVVDAGQLVTAAGVTAGIDLGLHLVRRLMGDEAADAIARQMECHFHPWSP